MLLRLKVDGFKSLSEVDVRFGPFTCIAGENGAGKSNLFDAIRFLSLTADHTFQDAARQIREADRRTGDYQSIFTGSSPQPGQRLEFHALVLVPRNYVDDLGQPRQATSTLLEYRLILALREAGHPSGPIELVSERVSAVRKSDARRELGFPLTQTWIESAVFHDRAARSAYLEPEGDDLIKRTQDQTQGRSVKLPRASTPRSILSSAQATEVPTLAALRNELQSWRFLLLDPVALRKPDDLDAPSTLDADGGHLPSTLARITGKNGRSDQVLATVANRVSELYPEVRGLELDVDDRRGLRTILVHCSNGMVLPAKALSDGTLRYLALAVLAEDSSQSSLFCLEEPENGVHPSRIGPMVRLLKTLALDPAFRLDDDNPPRQIIVNTHSPLVVNEVDAKDDLILVRSSNVHKGTHTESRSEYRCVGGSWRESAGMLSAYRSQFDSYLIHPDFLPESPLVERSRRLSAQMGLFDE